MSLLAPVHGTPYVGGEVPAICGVSASGLQANWKVNYAGVAAPTATDDSSKGYSVGSRWYYGTNIYECVSAGVGAAVWSNINAVTSPAGSGTELQYRNAGAFGAVAGTSWDGTTLVLPRVSIASNTWTFTSGTILKANRDSQIVWADGILQIGSSAHISLIFQHDLPVVYFGNGSISLAAKNATLRGTGGFSTNNPGGTIYIAPGTSTGNATPGSVVIQSTVAGTSGSTAQTLVDTLFISGGKVGVGVPTPTGVFGVRKDQNAATYAVVHNNTSGTAAYAGLFVGDATDNRSVGTLALSAGFLTSGMLVAGTGAIFSSCQNGLNIGTNQAAQVSMWTSNTKRLEISSTGLATLTGDFAVASTNYHYWGASDVDGSWRIGRSGNDIVIERRESGSYVSSAAAALAVAADINMGENSVYFGSAETTTTPTGTEVSLNLGTKNHQTLDLSSASGDLTLSITPPSGPCAGTIIVVQGATARGLTISLTSGTLKWLGVPPIWSDDVLKYRLIPWRWNGTFLLLLATYTD